MEKFEHIDLSSSRGNPDRLIPVRAYLAAKLSPHDLKIIKSLNDHKGNLEVTFDKMEFDHVINYAGAAHLIYLEKIFSEAWSIENEYIVDFLFE